MPVVPPNVVPKPVGPEFPVPNPKPVEGTPVDVFVVDDPNNEGVDVVPVLPKAFVPAVPALDPPNRPPPPVVVAPAPDPNAGVPELVEEPKIPVLPVAGAPKGFAAGVEFCAGCPNPPNVVDGVVPVVLFAFDAF